MDKKDIPQEREVKKPINKGGRPRKNIKKSGVTRETRISIEGLRDVLTVQNKDPNYHYYWELDSSENGNRIQKRLLAGYDFVQSDEVTIGQASVYQSSNIGTIVRVPSGDQYLYLMKIPMEWHKEDLESLERKNLEQVQAVEREEEGDGRYGKVEMTTSLKRSRTGRS